MSVCMIGMSGGVDSSVAAYMLKEQGYDCIGVTMKLFADGESGCCTKDDAADAKSVCRRLGIPHYTLNFTAEFERDVITPFVAAYEAGQTPNPCIFCNRHLKFQRLWQQAREWGCDCLATGHYAQVLRQDNGVYRLKKAADASKDQSYVLYFLGQSQLAHTRFPLGGLTKEQVRRIARQQGFTSAEKADSQDICFVPDGDYGAFLERYTGRQYAPGDFIDRTGRVLGRHRGAVRYTLGQRKGLGYSGGDPAVCTGKDMYRNTVTLGGNAELFTRSLIARDLCFTEDSPVLEGLQLAAKVRYRQTEQPCRVSCTGPDEICVEFQQPQRAVTAGQAVVLYHGDTIFGGGTIV